MYLQCLKVQLPVNAATVVERQHSPAEQGEEVARVGTSFPAHRTKVCNGHMKTKAKWKGLWWRFIVVDMGQQRLPTRRHRVRISPSSF